MGTAVPAIFVIFTISLMVPLLLIIAHVDDLAVQRRRRDHGRTHEQGTASRAPLAPNEITVRRRSGNFAAIELVGIHRETHGTTRLAPFEAGFFEDLVQPFLFGEFFTSAEPGTTRARIPDLTFLPLAIFAAARSRLRPFVQEPTKATLIGVPSIGAPGCHPICS